MPSFDSGRAGSIGGWNIESRRTDSLNGIRFDSNRSDPTSTNDVILYRGASSSLRFWNGTSATTLGAAGASVNFTLNDAYDDGTSIAVDAGAVTLAGADEDTAVLAITGDGDSAGALIKLTHATNTRNDILGTGSTWSVTGQGYGTLTRLFAPYISTATAVDLVLHTNSGSNSSQMTITDAADGDITFAMNGTGMVVISGTTEANPALTISNGDVVISDGGLAITDDDTAAAVTITSTAAFLDASGAGVVTIVADATTTGRVLDINADGLTTGKILHLDMTELGATDGTGMYIECYDGTAGAAQFTVGLNGDTTITGAAGTDVLTLAAGDLVLSDGSITLADGDDSPALTVTNNTTTTSDVVKLSGTGVFTGAGASAFVQILQSGLTSGDAVSITTDGMTTGTALLLDSSGVIATTGRMLEVLADTATTPTGLISLSADALTSGIGLLIASEANQALTSGQLASFVHSASGTTVAANSGSLFSITSSTTELGTSTQDFDVLSLTRTSIHTTAGTLTATGSILKIENVATETLATLTDTVIGLEIVMDAQGTGDAISVTGLATGALCLDIDGIATSVDDVNITGTGVKADDTGVLTVTGTGAIAAGGSVLRVTSTGIPAAATSYMVDFDYSGATFTNNPDAVHIASDGTGRALHITDAGLKTSSLPNVDIESTNAGAVGAVLRLAQQGGTQAASDVLGQIVFLGEDVSAADNIYGQIQVVVVASTDGSEAGRFDFLAGDPTAGGATQAFRIVMDGTNAIASVGDGAATGIVSSLGNFDLQLQTGNATTGNITITDGAAGAITLTPNGVGAVDIAGKLLHSETTASSGAGAVAITGTVHEITTTGTGDSMSLANGTEGQILHVCYVAETAGGDTAILSPTSFNDTSITFTDVGESVTLLYTAAKWYVIGNGGCTIA